MLYTKNNFKDSFFKEKEESDLFDPLTKTLTRKVIYEYCFHLINTNIPFSFYFLDIDNFKNVNDNYGHTTGDELLIAISNSLIDCVSKYNGCVGRFGGDEFMIVIPGLNGYEKTYNFCQGLYNDECVFRRDYTLSNIRLFITATIGACSYPDDINDFDSLIAKVDKCLYRGKQKGRNCFIVYVEAKHKNLELNQKKLHIDEIFNGISKRFESIKNNKLENVFAYVCDALKISGIQYVNNNLDNIISVGEQVDATNFEKMLVFENLNSENYIENTNILTLRQKYPSILKNNNSLRSIAIQKIIHNKKSLGYLLFLESKVERIWQSEDKALMLYLSQLIVLNSLEGEGKNGN